jgi:hypothetical protein
MVVTIGKLDFTGKVEQVLLAPERDLFLQRQIDQSAFGAYAR